MKREGEQQNERVSFQFRFFRFRFISFLSRFGVCVRVCVRVCACVWVCVFVCVRFRMQLLVCWGHCQVGLGVMVGGLIYRSPRVASMVSYMLVLSVPILSATLNSAQVIVIGRRGDGDCEVR